MPSSGPPLAQLMMTAVGLASFVEIQAVQAKTAEEIYAEVSPSVVLVLGSARDGDDSLGSGVVVAHEKVATNCHVLRGQQDVTVATGTEEFAARLHAVDWRRDVCILQVPGLAAPALQMGTITKVRIGQKVYAIGSPEGLEATLSDGLVSGFRAFEIGTVIQTSAPISPGSSGGGLFDGQGTLIGLTTSGLDDAQNLNFAHPVDWIRELLSHTGVSAHLPVAEAPTPQAELPAPESEPPAHRIPAEPAVSSAMAGLIRSLSFTDVRFVMVNGTATVVGTVRSRSDCTAAGLRLAATYRTKPYAMDSVVYSVSADIAGVLEPRGELGFDIATPGLNGHTEDSPSRGRWWVRMDVVNVDEVTCP